MARYPESQLRLLALCACPGAKWNVIGREAQRPGGLERLLAGEVSESSREGRATQRAIEKQLVNFDRLLENAALAIDKGNEAGARLTTVLDDDYPVNLRVIYNLAPFLFYRGELHRDDARSVAVVGTRQPSDDGVSRAGAIAEALAKNGVTVLSGLARGIDTAAHMATLDAGGRTIAVIGTGILRTYPKENAELCEVIAERGAVVSQFWPDHPPMRSSFPLRNVVMSGMGQGTVVVEASKTSGAKMQARLAIEHRKRVFLLESLVTDQQWARDYLDRGAVEVRDVSDILDRLRSPEHIEHLSAQRRQLSLEAA
jgi:DNA processing protein